MKIIRACGMAAVLCVLSVAPACGQGESAPKAVARGAGPPAPLTPVVKPHPPERSMSDVFWVDLTRMSFDNSVTHKLRRLVGESGLAAGLSAGMRVALKVNTAEDGYDYGLRVTPNASGDFRIICNEFCGIGHHTMVGRVIVVDSAGREVAPSGGSR